MGCNCWGDNSRSIRPNRHTVPSPSRPAPPIQVAKSGPTQSTPAQAVDKQEVETERKCSRCGFFVKKVRYVDPVANITVEQYICTNPKCPNYG